MFLRKLMEGEWSGVLYNEGLILFLFKETITILCKM